MYNILKILFEAEKYHLNHHGRPITGDDYYAMPHGIVASETYTIIRYNLSKMDFYKNENNLLDAKRPPDADYCSESDMEALETGFDKYAGLDFEAAELKNHQEKSWNKHYVEGTSTKIPFEDLIDDDKKWLIDDLKGVSYFMVI